MMTTTNTTTQTLEQIAERMTVELAARREQAWPMRAAIREMQRQLARRGKFRQARNG
jgi:hypothetical protein